MAFLLLASVVFQTPAYVHASAKARSDNANGIRAVEVPGPEGVNCYAIVDPNLGAVGGGCLYVK